MRGDGDIFPAREVGASQRLFCFEQAIDAAIDDDFGMLQAALRVRNGIRGENVPIVIVLTKMDKNLPLVKKEGGAKNFVKNHWPALLAELKHIWIFMVSTVQTTTDAGGKTVPDPDSVPKNLEEPLKHCLDQMEEMDHARGVRHAQAAKIESMRASEEMAKKEDRRVMVFWTLVIIGIILVGAFVCGLIVVYG